MVHALPPRIDASAEEIARMVLNTPPPQSWKYLEEMGVTYRCVDCGREVTFPEVMNNDNRCEGCAKTTKA